MSDNKSEMTVIGADTLIRGEMTFQTSARILGKFEGKIISQGRVEIGSGADCKASVEAGTVIVDGVIEGDVIAHDRLEINGTAQIRGDVVAAKLVAAEGASLTGHCAVGTEAVKSVKTMGQLNGHSRHSKAAASVNGDLDSTLDGLESKLAGYARVKAD